jgi:hypothetical protein
MRYRNVYILLLLITCIIASATDIISRSIVRGELGIQINSDMLSTNSSDSLESIWFNNTISVYLVSKAKFDTSFFSIEYPNQPAISIVVWRNANFELRVAKTTPNSNYMRFGIVNSTLDGPIVDHAFGGPIFDILGNFQAESIPLNLSSLMNDVPFNFTCKLYTGFLRTPADIVVGPTYSIRPLAQLVSNFTDMETRAWFIWEHVSWRWELAHPSIFAFALLFYIFVFILLMVFSRKQPLASRGITPYLTNLINLISLITGVRNWVDTETRSKTGCLINGILTNPLSLSLVFASVLIYSRYIVMRIINNRKSVVVETRKTQAGGKSLMMKFYEFSQRWYVQSVIMFFLFVFISLTFVVIQRSRQTDFRECTTDKYVFITIGTIGFLCLVALFPITVYLSWDDVKSKNWRAIFFTDPLNYKFEVYILYTSVYIYVLVCQVSISRGLDRGEWWKPFVWSFQFHGLWIAQTGFPLFMTIITWISHCKKKVETAQMGIVLEDEKGLELFYEFARREFSVENVSCFVDIRQFEQEPDDEKAREMAEKIRILYLSGNDSELEINCAPAPREIVAKLLQDGSCDRGMFEMVKFVLIDNLGDTFSRLAYTREFALYKQEAMILKDWGIAKSKSYIKSGSFTDDAKVRLINA